MVTAGATVAGAGVVAAVAVISLYSPREAPNSQKSPSPHVATHPTPGHHRGETPTPWPQPTNAHVEPIKLVTKTFSAQPYTFGLTPEGWHFQGSTPSVALIVPDHGDTSDSMFDWEGKISITLSDSAVHRDSNMRTFDTLTVDGRPLTVWTTGDGYTQVITPTQPGEPKGYVRTAFPQGTGWDKDVMARFTASVSVGPDAAIVPG